MDITIPASTEENYVKYNDSMDNFIVDATQTESRDIHAIASRLSTQRVIRLLHSAMGLSTEANEFLDAMKKHIFYGKDLDITNIKEELGDMLWYLAIAFNEMGWSFEEVAAMVTAKLALRYPDKFTKLSALNRDLTAERALLEGKRIEILSVATEDDMKPVASWDHGDFASALKAIKWQPGNIEVMRDPTQSTSILSAERLCQDCRQFGIEHCSIHRSTTPCNSPSPDDYHGVPCVCTRSVEHTGRHTNHMHEVSWPNLNDPHKDDWHPVVTERIDAE